MSPKVKKLSPQYLYTHHGVRLAIFTGLSSAVAYIVATLIPLADPTVAAITGLVAISSTFHDSIKYALAETAGVILGSLAGIWFVHLLGFNVFTLGMLIVMAYLLAWVFKIGEKGAAAIGVTMILVSGPLFDNIVKIEGRIIGVVIGAFCALIASYFVLPGKPHQRALKGIRKESVKAAELLSRISVSLSEKVLTREQASEWVQSAKALTEASKEYLDDAKDAVKGSKWSPMLNRKETVKTYKQVKDFNTIVTSVNNICEDLHSYSVENEMTEELRETLSNLFKSTSEHIIAEIADIDMRTSQMTLSNSLQKRKRATIETVKSMDETQAIILGSSIVRDVSKIRESLQ